MSTKPSCVACQKSDTKSKLLRCLHTLCIVCLEKSISQKNTVTCPGCSKETPSPGEGRTHFLCLPDSCTGEEDSDSTSETKVVNCDECVKDTLATASCNECHCQLCEVHAKGHALSKLTSHHQITPMTVHQPGSSAKGKKHPCPLHTTRHVVEFCIRCHQVLCEVCRCSTQHQEHQEAILSLEEANKKARLALEPTLRGCAEGDETLSRAIEKAEASLTVIDERMEKTASAVSGTVDTIFAALKQRETQLKQDLEALREAKAGLLEEQLARLKTSLAVGHTVTNLAATCHDEVNFLRMWEWLREAAMERAATMAKDEPKPIISEPKFHTKGVEQVLQMITTMGAVWDAQGSSSNSSTPERRLSGRNFKNQSPTGSQHGYNADRPATDEQMRAAILQSGQLVENSGRSLQRRDTQEQLMGRGNLQTASGHARNSTGSISAGPPQPNTSVVFDKTRSNPNLKIFNSGRTVRATDSSGWMGAIGVVTNSDRVIVRIRLDTQPQSSVFVCMCNAKQPVIDGYHSKRAEVFGWYDMTEENFMNGTKLGQPWKKGDIIRISLNNTQHKLTGVHERTGQTQSLNVTGNPYLYVALYGNSPEGDGGMQVSLM